MELILILMILLNILTIIYIFKLRNTLKNTKKELNNLKDTERTFEQSTFIELTHNIEAKKNDLSKIEEQERQLTDKNQKLLEEERNKEKEINELKTAIDILKDDIELQDYGIYEPQFNFASALIYKDKLKNTRDIQKKMIKDKTAVSYFEGWTVDGSKAKGKKMTNNNIKQILRSFNNECDVLIGKVTYRNFESVKNRIRKIYDQLNKLSETQRLSITPSYLDLKFNELHLAFEYARKKEEEKEKLRQQREKEREEKALQKEINDRKEAIDKDIKHYKNLIDILAEKIKESISEEEKESIEKEMIDIRNNINDKEQEREELDYREAHSSAGYVYIISNIGAFGKEVVKIGVTRRLDPIERIKELSNASVPFTYDIHALIFSYEAYALEGKLHQYFDKYRVNKINTRKEFFKVPIEDIEDKLKEYGDLTIDFSKTVKAEEYRESLAIEKELVS